VGLLAIFGAARAQETASLRPGDARIVSIEGQPVEVSRAGSNRWDPADKREPYCILKPGDQLRTGPGCRALVRLSDLTVIRVGPLSYLQIPPERRKRGFNLFRGILYFFHRDRPGEFELQTPTVSAVVRGTEFNLKVEDDGTTTLSMFDGEVDLSNPQGQLQLKSGQGAIVKPHEAPTRAPAFEGESVIQWLLYYPGFLDVDELGLTREEQQPFAASLAAYRSGDLLAARTNFMAVITNLPSQRAAVSDRIRVYQAALDLAVGNVTNSLRLTRSLRAEAVAQERPVAQERAVARPAVEGGAVPPAVLGEALAGVVEAVSRPAADVRLRALPAKGFTLERALGIEKRRAPPQLTEPTPRSSTVQMRRSILLQSEFDLEGALRAARAATEISPNFGFAHERVAELEFSLGRVPQARAAVEQALRFSPRNAQALALRGYLFSAESRIPQAITFFDRAIDLDGGLPTAWAGRGLCKIRQGRAEEGRLDLQMAATIEPQVSIWRSYLGKAFSNEGDNKGARREFALAQKLDPNDPTSYLYSALLNQEDNRINEAVRDLEKSLELNEARGLQRGQRLLDQDRAVRSANLALMYQDAGMPDVAVRTAMRTLNADYANYMGHYFLGSSYNAARGVGRVDVRFETPALAEYLVANLESSASAGTLSPYVTQQEYSKLFEKDRLGFASSTEYLSRGAWLETASQYGNYGSSAYSVDMLYRSDPGQRPNNDIFQVAPSVTLKQELSQKDMILFQGQYAYTDSGDLSQDYYNIGDPNVRVKESLEPMLLAGYRRAWTPWSQTLALFGYFNDNLVVDNPDQSILLLFMNTNATRVLAAPLGLFDPTTNLNVSPLDYDSRFQAFSAELQQVFKFREDSLVFGGRFQTGTFDTESTLGPSSFAYLATNATLGPRLLAQSANPYSQPFENDFHRFSVYGYYNWRVTEPLLLTAGLSYDQLLYPQDFRYVPISDQERRTDQVSPKVGLFWTPTRNTAVRMAYAQSLGGVSFDQSIRLEPTQVGGFNQSFRSLIPESVVGSVAGARFENAGVAWDQRFDTGTYLGLRAEWLHSSAEQALGTVEIIPPTDPFGGGSFAQRASTTSQNLEYYERNFTAVFNQLVGRDWSLGVRYRISDASLDSVLTQIPFAGPLINSEREATLQQVDLFVLFNHPSGVFSGFDALWSQQSNRGYTPDRPGDDFWQFNAFIGYRFYRRHAELRLALLNITDQDYQLNQLNLTSDLPRDRTLAVTFKLNF
jgi:tetratricopeptide (TPR) repeat protein